MKYFVVFALIAAVASAAVLPTKPTEVAGELAQIQEIIAAINHPSTDPVTAALLEQLLLDTLGVVPQPIAVGPAIVDQFEPIAVGPAIIDFPLPDGGAVSAPVVPVNPVIVAPVETPAAAASSPLVQIIVNVIAAGSDAPAVNPATPENVIEIGDVSPVLRPDPTPEWAEVVDVMPVVNPEPIQVIDVMPVIIPEPVQVVEPALPVLPEPVVLPEPILPEPVQVAEPVIPVNPAITLPEELN